MKKLDLWPWLFMVLLPACTGLKKSALLHKSESSTHYTAQVQAKSSQQQQFLRLDTATAFLEVELHPIDQFTYSASDGFVGEATQLRVRKKETQGSQQLLLAQGQSSAQQQLQLEQQQCKRLKNSTKPDRCSGFGGQVWDCCCLVLFIWTLLEVGGMEGERPAP